MSTRTTTTSRPSTANNPNRGRGRGFGRGRQANHAQPQDKDPYHMIGNTGRGIRPSKNSCNRGNFSFRSNNNGYMKCDRSDKATRSPSPALNPSTIPKHSQNPFFVEHLMSRFNSILPSPNFLEDEEPEPNADSNAENKRFENEDRCNPGKKYPTWSNSGNPPGHDVYYQSETGPSLNRERQFENVRMNQDHETNRPLTSAFSNQSVLENEIGLQEPRVKGMRFKNGSRSNSRNSSMFWNVGDPQVSDQPSAERLFHLEGQPENRRMSDKHSLNVCLTKSSNDQNEIVKQEPDSNIYYKKLSSITEKSNGKHTTQKVNLEQRKQIMAGFGYNVEKSVKECSDRNNVSVKNNPTQSSEIGNRTTPRVRYLLESSQTQDNAISTNLEKNENDNSKSIPKNQNPNMPLLLNSKEHKKPNNFVGLGNANSNIRNINSSLEKSSDKKDVNKGINSDNAINHSSVGDMFSDQLDKLIRSNNPGIFRFPLNSAIGREPQNNQDNGENRGFQTTKHNLNPSLRNQEVSQNHPDGREIHGKIKRKSTYENSRAALFVSPSKSSTFIEQGDVAGGNRYNVQRPVMDVNERVPSREEALARLQENYKMQRDEYEAKKREKEAKKREEYLARYKHVDQGHRLNEGLLDEAAGYAPGYNFTYTVEDVRQRQQEQFMRDALAYQEQKKEEEERQKRLKEKKEKEKFEKLPKHYSDVGQRLGYGNIQAPGYNFTYTVEDVRQQQQEQFMRDALAYQEQKEEEEEREKRMNEKKEKEKFEKRPKHYSDAGHRLGHAKTRQNFPNTGVKPKQQKHIPKGNKKQSSEIRAAAPLSPELLIENETEEDAFLRQEEQLILEMVIDAQLKNRQAFEEVHSKEDIQHSDNSVAMSQFPTAKTVKLNDGFTVQGVVHKNPPAKYNQNNEHVQNKKRNITNDVLKTKEEHECIEIKCQNEISQTDLMDLKVTRNSMSEAGTSRQVTNHPEPLITTAGCTLKNRNGAVLVLRPTPEDLNQALATRLEVLDEMDKLGYSLHYKPQAEQKPLFSNSRFERKPNIDFVKSTVAIPKSTSASESKKDNTIEEEKSAYDPKAELREARLRFQRQYEEALRKKQEEKNNS